MPASNLTSAFERAAKAKRAAFIPYITAGDPNLAATKKYVKTLADCGADVIELGVPFSDPVADGPVNQAAATRAIRAGTTLAGVLELIAELRREGVDVPIVLFTYLNPIYKMGYETFAKRAAKAGADGVLVVDLPPEEAERDYLPRLREHGLGTVFLSSPTTDPKRLPLIDRQSTGFVYYASRTGVTGVQKSLSTSLGAELEKIRRHVKGKLAVGFGISTPEQVRELVPLVDAVVVGSAFVRLIEKNKDIAPLAKELVAALGKK
ncbi:MAG: tryptophan synthase subunit alpha [Deltaproteobacteria bacterium]|nr:tryptophan synthase subunit alpha [Deltaproteobacteria bacterium]